MFGGGWREGLFGSEDYEAWIGQTRFTVLEETDVGEKRTERTSQDEDGTPRYKYRRTDDLPISRETEAEISPEPETVPGDESTRPDSGHKDNEMTVEKEKRGATEIEDDENQTDEHPMKRIRVDLIEVLLQSVEKAMAAKLKKEVNYKNLSDTAKVLFKKAIEKEIRNNIETGAYEVLSPQESERIRREKEDKIVKSRYVLTEKGIEEEDIDKARCEGVLLADDGPSSKKAKARHVMKGFSEENSEYLEVTTPQVARDSVMLTLQLLCSRRWKPGYLDFTGLSQWRPD